MLRLLLIGFLLVVAIFAGVVWFSGTSSSFEWKPKPDTVGVATPGAVVVSNPHGTRRISVYLEQDNARHQIAGADAPRRRYFSWGRRDAPTEVKFVAGSKAVPALHDGKARLVVEAQSNDLRSRVDRTAVDVTVNTKPPGVIADEHQHYINQGGSELVVFTPAGYWTEAGVRAGANTYRSWPFPGDPSRRFSIFGFSWDTPPKTAPQVFVRNPAGAEATASFWHRVFPKRFRRRELPLDDGFLEKVVNQISPGGSGTLIERFLRINGEMRRANNARLAALRDQTEERVLWSGPFVQLGSSKVEAQFADVRTYLYQGKKVDEQVHLGFDLSVVKNTPVAASNNGKVIFAEPLGIYGNCIVIDHGYSLQSIYAHLSEFGVKAGDQVTKGQTIGKSGATGLAGGDHLHFSMQVDGIQVNPVEWWDAHWIQDRILSKLPAPK